jgi:hypothetical protein
VIVASPLTVQGPLQVMLHVPLPHATFDPAPTVCVQDFPLQATLQLSPHEPPQVASLSQVRRQPLVEPEHASKVHDSPFGQSHDVPLHTELPQFQTDKRSTDSERTEASTRRKDFIGSLRPSTLEEPCHGHPSRNGAKHASRPARRVAVDRSAPFRVQACVTRDAWTTPPSGHAIPRSKWRAAGP